jgi:hypothetical protein
VSPPISDVSVPGANAAADVKALVLRTVADGFANLDHHRHEGPIPALIGRYRAKASPRDQWKSSAE